MQNTSSSERPISSFWSSQGHWYIPKLTKITQAAQPQANLPYLPSVSDSCKANKSKNQTKTKPHTTEARPSFCPLAYLCDSLHSMANSTPPGLWIRNLSLAATSFSWSVVSIILQQQLNLQFIMWMQKRSANFKTKKWNAQGFVYLKTLRNRKGKWFNG